MNVDENRQALVHSLSVAHSSESEASSFRVTEVIPNYVECLRDIGNGSGTGQPKAELFDEAARIVGKPAASRIRTRAKKLIEWVPQVRTREALTDVIEERSIRTEAELDRYLDMTPRGEKAKQQKEDKRAAKDLQEEIAMRTLAAASRGELAAVILRERFECSFDEVEVMAREIIEAIRDSKALGAVDGDSDE